MLENYFKIAWRNIARNRSSSLINLSGLAIGMTCVMLISLYIKNEVSYDRSFEHNDRIFRVNVSGKMGAEEFYVGYTPPPAGAALLKNFPEFESYARIYRPGEKVVRNPDGSQKLFTEKGIFGVDSNFLDVLDYPLKYGNPSECLLQPNSVVITEEIAKKYFGDENPMGRELLFDQSNRPLTITGVLDDSAGPFSLSFDMLMPISNFSEVKEFDWSWVWLGTATYVKLKENVPVDEAAIKRLEAKFPSMMKVEALSAFAKIGQPYDEFLKKGGRWDLDLQPLKDIHLHSGEIFSAVTDQGDIKYVYIFAAIGLFIVLLACVNFMNLSTAQASKRSKEIGIRKVLGSDRGQLIRQFLNEAFIYTGIASGIALIAATLLIPAFNQLSGKELEFSSFFTDGTWLILLGLVIFSALIAGSYPAFYLTSFNPVSVLKGAGLFKSNQGNRFLRSSLVVFQFTVSTCLVICTLIVYNQLDYTRSRDMGLTKENVLIISNSNRLGTSEKSFRDEIIRMPGVINASISTSVPTKGAFGDFFVPIAGKSDTQVAKDIVLASYMSDENFIPVMDLKIVAGRGFSKNFSDSASVILNEAAVRQIGWKEPLGQYIRYPGGEMEVLKVVGVVKDFNQESLHYQISPFVLFHSSSRIYETQSSYISVKIKPENLTWTLSDIENKWASFGSQTPLDYSFLDNDFEALYRSDQRTGSVFTTFTFLSIFIACLGLFGLVAFAAEQRTKEIGIRKVLGASVTTIVELLSREFILLILISIAIAVPVSWWAMDYWLQDFEYRISISWPVFALAAVLAILIALATLSFQAIKAAVANPVRSLRSE